jgi:two-component system, OmpR family, phosphate regulon sensor histidine kinase PhoR
MNPFVPDVSLLQYLQRLDPQLPVVTVSSSCWQGVLSSLLDLLSEPQIKAIVWLKLPRSMSWYSEIDRYLQSGNPERVYLCSIRDEKTPSPPLSASPALINVDLEASSHLQREYFVIVLSPVFSCLLLARQQISTTATEQTWQLGYYGDVNLINQVLQHLQQAITITDTTPEEILTSVPVAFTPDNNPLWWQQLLLKQIQHTETLQKQVSQEENTAQKIASLADSLKYSREVLGSLTQELKLPLTNMKTALRLLDSMQSKREQRQRYIDLLQRECDRQSLLLTGLQEFIQFTQNLSPAINDHLKLDDLIPGIVSTYQPLAEEKGIVLGYTIAAGLPAVAIPEACLRQILLNLLSNSLKFTPKNGRIQVQASLKSEHLEISISDTGSGIEQGDIPYIFQSFYKGRNAVGSASSGAGLGLTLVKYLMTQWGGSIAINSKVGKGTICTLNLPIIPGQ